MVPANLRRETAQQAVLVTSLKPQNPKQEQNKKSELNKLYIVIIKIEKFQKDLYLRASGMTILLTLS